ncbi:hypothetical protein HK098_005006 [Nowakowskiella sp. JEL0407]|nr:hypothetical protein HK098_005006 [Nowakowskiella sp. JEL0407]
MSINPINQNTIAVAGSESFVFLHDRRNPGKPFLKIPAPKIKALDEGGQRRRQRSMFMSDLSVTSVKFGNLDSNELIVSYNPGHAFLFDVADMHMMDDEVVVPPIGMYAGHSNIQTTKDITFLGPKDEYIVSGSDDGCMYIYNKQSQTLQNVLYADTDVVNVIAGNPFETTIAVSGIDNTVKIFEGVYPSHACVRDSEYGVDLFEILKINPQDWGVKKISKVTEKENVRNIDVIEKKRKHSEEPDKSSKATKSLSDEAAGNENSNDRSSVEVNEEVAISTSSVDNGNTESNNTNNTTNSTPQVNVERESNASSRRPRTRQRQIIPDMGLATCFDSPSLSDPFVPQCVKVDDDEYSIEKLISKSTYSCMIKDASMLVQHNQSRLVQLNNPVLLRNSIFNFLTRSRRQVNAEGYIDEDDDEFDYDDEDGDSVISEDESNGDDNSESSEEEPTETDESGYVDDAGGNEDSQRRRRRRRQRERISGCDTQ